MMTSNDLNLEQCQRFLADAERHAKYFESVYNRMTTLGFGPQDELLKAVQGSRDQCQRVVYQLRGLIGRKAPPRPEVSYPPLTDEEIERNKQIDATVKGMKRQSRRRR